MRPTVLNSVQQHLIIMPVSTLRIEQLENDHQSYIHCRPYTVLHACRCWSVKLPIHYLSDNLLGRIFLDEFSWLQSTFPNSIFRNKKKETYLQEFVSVPNYLKCLYWHVTFQLMISLHLKRCRIYWYDMKLLNWTDFFSSMVDSDNSRDLWDCYCDCNVLLYDQLHVRLLSYWVW